MKLSKTLPVVFVLICGFSSLLNAKTEIKHEPFVMPSADIERPAEDIAMAKITAAVVAEPIASGPVEPTKESIQKMTCPDWFRDAKFGIWSHCGPGCVSEVSQNYARDMYLPGHWGQTAHIDRFGDPLIVGYKDILKYWTGDKWEPEDLMKKYKAAGAKYFVSMGRHHDNVDLYDSKYTYWNSVNIGPKKDVVGLWRKAALAEGLHFGISIHERDDYYWNYLTRPNPVKYDSSDPKYWSLYLAPPGFPGAKKEFLDGFYARLKDAIDKYEPELLYFDGGISGEDTHGAKIVAHYYNSSIKRNGGVNKAVLNTKTAQWGVRDLERGVYFDIAEKPWQDDTSESGWFYLREESAGDTLYTIHRSSTTMLHLLIDVVSKNGNLLMNIPQRADGTIDEHCEVLLEDFAEWMKINSESIFETRPWKVYGEGPSRSPSYSYRHKNRTMGTEWKSPMISKDIRFTQSKDKKTVYIFVLGTPRETISIKSFADEKIANISLLGSSDKVVYKQTADALEIEKANVYPCRHAVVFKVTLAENAVSEK